MNNNEIKKARPTRRIVVAVLAVALVVSIVASLLVYFLWDDGGFDYLTSDLSSNIIIDAADYSDYALNLKCDTVTDETVKRQINALLYKNKSDRPENNGGEEKSVPITLGDKAYIYYLVKVGDEVVSAKKSLVDATEYGVGSYLFEPLATVDRSGDWTVSYITDIDDALIGIVPNEHKLTSGAIVTSGAPEAEDRIVFSYTDGEKSRLAYTTLSECDSVFGDGMSEFLKNAEASSTRETLCCSLSGESRVYNNIRIEYLIRSEIEPLTVSFTFPANYGNKELRGTEGSVEIWFRGSVVYNTPEYNEEFITKTLGIGEDELSKYEGDDIISRHSAMLRSQCEDRSLYIRERIVEEAVWDYLVSRAKVTELPREALEESYNAIYSALYIDYVNIYSAFFETPESFLTWIYGLESTSNVSSYVLGLAEREVTEKLVFYSIAREQELLLSGDALTSAYEAAVDENFVDYLALRESSNLE